MDHQLSYSEFSDDKDWREESWDSEAESSVVPTLIFWKHKDQPISGFKTLCTDDDSEVMHRFGLSEKPAILLIRSDGEEFARLEGDQISAPRFTDLIWLFENESRIIQEAGKNVSRSSIELVKLFIAQRRLNAAIHAWRDFSGETNSLEVCHLARQIADLALQMARHDAAIPLLEYVKSHEIEELARVEAWSRLIWCHLTLGHTNEARLLSEDPDRPSARYKEG